VSGHVLVAAAAGAGRVRRAAGWPGCCLTEVWQQPVAPQFWCWRPWSFHWAWCWRSRMSPGPSVAALERGEAGAERIAGAPPGGGAAARGPRAEMTSAVQRAPMLARACLWADCSVLSGAD